MNQALLQCRTPKTHGFHNDLSSAQKLTLPVRAQIFASCLANHSPNADIPIILISRQVPVLYEAFAKHLHTNRSPHTKHFPSISQAFTTISHSFPTHMPTISQGIVNTPLPMPHGVTGGFLHDHLFAGSWAEPWKDNGITGVTDRSTWANHSG